MRLWPSNRVFPAAATALAALAFVCTVPALPACGQQTVLPLWPRGTPEPAQTAEAEADVTKPTDSLYNGRRSIRFTNVTNPTLTVYPAHNGNGAAALVFPGGGYVRLAWNGEGTDACEWLNSLGIVCLLVKYRVPEKGRYPDNPADLEDAQQAVRLARAHAAEWHIDPNRIGVVGFSAGGNLAVLLSTHPDDNHIESTPAASQVPMQAGAPGQPGQPIDARVNFAIIVYPAYLPVPPEQTQLDPVYTPDAFTPPTFLLQAENDHGYGKNALVYYRALLDTGHPAQLHYYATGGHGFGVHPTGTPEEHWTDLAATWLREIHAIPDRHGSAAEAVTGAAAVSPVPCITPPQPQQTGQSPRPSDNGSVPQPPCY
jgi:acetyl esterase/lipase